MHYSFCLTSQARFLVRHVATSHQEAQRIFCVRAALGPKCHVLFGNIQAGRLGTLLSVMFCSGFLSLAEKRALQRIVFCSGFLGPAGRVGSKVPHFVQNSG